MPTPEELLTQAADEAVAATQIATEWANKPAGWFSATESGPLPSIKEFNQQQVVKFEHAIANTGWLAAAGSFESGGTITTRNQYLQLVTTVGGDVAGGYSWGGTLPKVVAPGSTPATAGGTPTDGTGWVYRGETTVRAALEDGSADIDGKPASYITNITSAGGKRASIISYGATGADGENIRTSLAAAYADGVTQIDIPNKSFNVGSSIDLTGATLIGQDAVFTGSTITNAEFHGIKVKNKNDVCTVLQSPQTIATKCTPKLFFRRTATTAALITRNATDNEYIYHVLGQTSDSVPAASVGAPFELMRAQQKRRCINSILMRKQYDSSSGTVATLATILDAYFATGAGITRLDSANSAANPVQAWNLSQAASITYDFVGRRYSKNADKFNVAVYATSGSSEINEIYVNGVLVKTFTAVADGAGSSIKIVPFEVDLRTPSGALSIEIKNNSASGVKQLYVLGLNLRELRDAESHIGDDYFVFWYLTDNAYSDTNGAGDYAYQDQASGLFAGSYHGGEVSSYLRFVMDGTQYDATSLPVLGYKVGNQFSIKQRTTINSQFDSYNNLNYDQDGVEVMKCHMTPVGANVGVINFYTNLFPASDGFDYVLYPDDFALAGTENTFGIGRDTNEVVQLNQTTTQYVRHSFTKFKNDRNFYGGPYMWNRVGTYRKLYYGPVISNYGEISYIEFEYQREFGFGKY